MPKSQHTHKEQTPFGALSNTFGRTNPTMPQRSLSQNELNPRVPLSITFGRTNPTMPQRSLLAERTKPRRAAVDHSWQNEPVKRLAPIFQSEAEGSRSTLTPHKGCQSMRFE